MEHLSNLNNNLIQDNGDYADFVTASTGLDNKKSYLEGALKEKSNQGLDLEDKVLKQYQFNNKDIGFNSPTSDSFIRLKENGIIEVLANEKTGVCIDPIKKNINIFADHINLKASVINHECEPMGFRINGYALNPLFYHMCNNGLSKTTISDFTVYGHGRVWKEGLMGPGYVRDVVEFKPFFPLGQDTMQLQLDAQSGWEFERGDDDEY